jgi:hypothetical protein
MRGNFAATALRVEPSRMGRTRDRVRAVCGGCVVRAHAPRAGAVFVASQGSDVNCYQMPLTFKFANSVVVRDP